MRSKDDPKKLAGEVQMFRIRVTTAESKLKVLREQARQAKRRSKEAKRSAKRARKEFKRFKAEVAEQKQSLAKAEVKLFKAGNPALAKKMAKARSVANSSASPLKMSKTVARKPRPALLRKSRAPRRVTREKPPITQAKVVSDGPAVVATLDHATDTSNP